MTELESESPEETERLAGRLAAELVAGDVVLVQGELGAGKTTFVRGAARALGVEGPVTSHTSTFSGASLWCQNPCNHSMSPLSSAETLPCRGG